MSAHCIWSEESLANRHPRYKALFARKDRSRSTTPARSRSRANTQEWDASGAPGQGNMIEVSTPGMHCEGRQARMEQETDNTIDLAVRTNPVRERTQSSPPPPLPAAPRPSADEAIHEVNAKVVEQLEQNGKAGEEIFEEVDIWAMRPVQAMELLCTYVQTLISQSGHKLPKPPTPPSSGNSSKHASPVQTPPAVDENRRPSHDAGLAPPSSLVSPGPTSPQHPFLQRVPRASRTPIDSPVSHPQSPIPPTHPASPLPLPLDKTTHIVAQSDKLARKFYCKSAPPVALSDYLARLHKYCPGSVAVYLAAGVYIERLTRKRNSRRGSFPPLTPVSSNSQQTPQIDGVLAEDTQDVPEGTPLVEVTSKSVHRLLLAALRVAQKALEDGVFPHRRVALVGGVSELELSRLEVSMCFLTDFELVLKLRDMERWVRQVKSLERTGKSGG